MNTKEFINYLKMEDSNFVKGLLEKANLPKQMNDIMFLKCIKFYKDKDIENTLHLTKDQISFRVRKACIKINKLH